MAGIAHTLGKVTRFAGLAAMLLYLAGWIIALAGLALSQKWCAPRAHKHLCGDVHGAHIVLTSASRERLSEQALPPLPVA